VRRKRAHQLWQLITAKKRKLRKRNQSAETRERMGESLPTMAESRHNLIAEGGYNQIDSRDTAANMVVANTSSEEVSYHDSHPVPYDEDLLERSRTQWQFGDWESLAQLSRDTLQHHPDRAKLALLAAAGHLQTNNTSQARQFINLAKDWGISKKLLTQILVAGVHNSLARAATISGQQPRALQHFQAAIQTGAPGSDRRLLTEARINEQCAQLGLPALTNSAALQTGHFNSPAATYLAHASN